MKKFLTVLLALSVVFTYSFSAVGSVFAYTEEQLQNVVGTHEAAVKAIQDKYDKNLAAINADYASKVKTPGNADKDAWKAACDVALDEAKADLNKELAEAWNTLDAEEKKVENPKGWDIGNATPDPGYVNAKAALDELTTEALDSAVINNHVGEAGFNAAMAKTVALIKAYDLEQFVKDDDYNKTGKSSYETAVAAQAEALALLASYKYDDNTANQIYAVYKIEGVGTLGEKESGSFYNAIKDLKTVDSLKTDEAKIAYAKNIVTNDIKKLIAEEKEKALKVQNDLIFQESISAKPNQSVIDKANEEIAKINKQYDAYAKVWTYRLDNGKYVVENTDNSNSYVNLMYGDKKIAYLAKFENGRFVKTTSSIAYNWGTLTKGLPLADGETIVKYVEELEKEAADLKATIEVDGNTYVDVDAALADAVKETYMTGVKAALSVTLSSNVVHVRAHQLIGKNCVNQPISGKVTVNGKSYDSVANWSTAGYSPNNTKAVKAIKEEAVEAIMAATSVADADSAFLAAYEKYDAVLTTSEQRALFAYNGPLYKKDAAAKAELNAYVDYKVSLAGLDAGVAAALKADINTNLLTEVNNEADLNAAVAAYKAIVDGLKTKDEMKASDKALRDKIVAVKRPVTIAQKEEVIALYNEYLKFDAYCTQVDYNNIESDAVKAILETDVKKLAALEKDAMDDLVKAIDKDGVTLADRDNVKALVNAMTAYNELYFEYKLVSKYTTDKDYEEILFNLDVEAAEALIRALPSEASTAAKIKEARDAVNALGFKGKCAISATLLTKLNRLEQNLIYEVKSLKITVSTKLYTKSNKIRVNWKVKGDASYIDGYQVYKSTKAQKNYKYMGKTKKSYMDNKKGLKKGTRYFYKVRAYKDVNGERIYSDWSNKGNRIYK